MTGAKNVAHEAVKVEAECNSLPDNVLRYTSTPTAS